MRPLLPILTIFLILLSVDSHVFSNEGAVPGVIVIEGGAGTSYPSTEEGLLSAARGYLREKDFEKAETTYRRLLERFKDGAIKHTALYELAYVLYRTGRPWEARTYLEKVASHQRVDRSVKGRAELLLNEIDSIYERGRGYSHSSPAIGAMLPLRGSYGHYGEGALKGVLLAAGVFGSGSSVTVLVRDVGPEPGSAERAVRELSEYPVVAGLVGPLLSVTAYEGAEAAGKKGIPLITLAQKEGVTGAGEYVFRNSLLPRDQAKTIARYAYRELGLRTFAVIYPENSYGSALSRYFVEEVKDLGGTITRAASYTPGTTDFSPLLKEVFRIREEERKEGRRTVKKFSPALVPDGLFIPDYHEGVSLITPYLKYFEIRGVRLLGANGWNSEALISHAGSTVEGAVFVDGFFAGSQRPGTVEFTKKFKNTFGASPGLLEAQAYDAAKIMLDPILENPGTPGRELIKARLRERRDFRGAEGVLFFDSKGEARKRLFILTVKKGRIIEYGEGEL